MSEKDENKVAVKKVIDVRERHDYKVIKDHADWSKGDTISMHPETAKEIARKGIIDSQSLGKTKKKASN